VTYEVRFSKRSQADLISIYEYISARSDSTRALAYFERIRDYCLTLSRFPQRGTSWEYISRGVRVVGFERRVSIVFRIKSRTVTIVRVLYGGRSLEKHLKAGRRGTS
jgi:toxin ParE1/3/4